MYDDTIIWNELDSNDLWIYDKLILSRKLGYICGPVGIDVPTPGLYVVRPITNIMGMGQGAEITYVDKSTDHLPIGYFWCEIFTGRHISIDYHNGEQILCVEGVHCPDEPNNLYKWKYWKRVNENVPYPKVLEKVYPYVNCEFIGNNLIEIQLRRNPDFKNNEQIIYPVWHNESTTPPEDMKFISDRDYKRLGFFTPK